MLKGAILSFNNRNLNFNPLSTKISNKHFRFIATLICISSFRHCLCSTTRSSHYNSLVRSCTIVNDIIRINLAAFKYHKYRRFANIINTGVMQNTKWVGLIFGWWSLCVVVSQDIGSHDSSCHKHFAVVTSTVIVAVVVRIGCFDSKVASFAVHCAMFTTQTPVKALLTYRIDCVLVGAVKQPSLLGCGARIVLLYFRFLSKCGMKLNWY